MFIQRRKTIETHRDNHGIWGFSYDPMEKIVNPVEKSTSAVDGLSERHDRHSEMHTICPAEIQHSETSYTSFTYETF